MESAIMIGESKNMIGESKKKNSKMLHEATVKPSRKS
jgi:hypothetical protein